MESASPSHSHSHSHSQSHSHHDERAPHGSDPEREHLEHVIRVYEQYRMYSLSANARRRKDFLSISVRQQRMLPEYLDFLARIDQLIVENADMMDMITQDARSFLIPDDPEGDREPMDPGTKSTRRRIPEQDLDRLRSTLKQFVRDWSDEGRKEREACYSPVLTALEHHFSSMRTPEERATIKVLVPGAGLGRLAWDVARRGFSCQGNEFSLYMLIASNFVLNHTVREYQYTVYPFLHSISNIKTKADLLSPIRFPDVLPSDLPQEVDFSMAAGDFVEVYSKPENKGRWNAVVTCFFLDTAKNIVEYLEIIHSVLAPGGLWVNLGPNLWHWENSPQEELSIEMTMEDVKGLAKTMGFSLHDERDVETTYTGNPSSSLQHVYSAAFWVATKE